MVTASSRNSFLLLLCTCTWTAAQANIQIPFLSKKKYTPLIFFKSPPGISPECDLMETTVGSVEKDLEVKVERMDVYRDPVAGEILKSIVANAEVPFLYNRESRQVVSMAEGSDIDKDRVRAWAKGRRLPDIVKEVDAEQASNIPASYGVTDSEQGMDQEELLDEEQLTPLQREGKKAIKERTKAKGEANQKS